MNGSVGVVRYLLYIRLCVFLILLLHIYCEEKIFPFLCGLVLFQRGFWFCLLFFVLLFIIYLCFYPQKLALTSPTSSGRSVGIVHSQTKATELVS
jgi:hypothetical protein